MTVCVKCLGVSDISGIRVSLEGYVGKALPPMGTIDLEGREIKGSAYYLINPSVASTRRIISSETLELR